jgi:hypothetical protein
MGPSVEDGRGATIKKVVMNVTKSVRGQFCDVTDQLTATAGQRDLLRITCVGTHFNC